MRDNRLVESNSPKSEWAKDLPAGPPLKDDLARLVDEDGARDEAECSYLEAASDSPVRAERDGSAQVPVPAPTPAAAPFG
jgi:hypothetical protein